MKVLFCVTHLGLLRHYAPVVQRLVDRGHDVHLACEEFDRGLGVDPDLERIKASVTGVTFSDVPVREKNAWAAWSYRLHLLMDWVRYFDPRFASADALRSRVEHQVPRRSAALLRGLRRLDPTGRGMLRVMRALDRLTPPNPVIQRFIAEARPDLVVVSPYVYIGYEQADHVKAAKALGIRTAVGIASWDNLTNKGIIHSIPDRVFVWNEAQREEATTLHGVPAAQVVATGAQLFDRWFDRTPSRSREEFCRQRGLDPSRPFILYTGSSDFIAPREGAFVRRWVELVRGSADPAVATAGILIRPHPKNFAQFMALDLGHVDHLSIWPLGAKSFDPTFDDDFFDSLYHSHMVVGINTSAQIEAAIVGRPVRTWQAPEFVHSQEGTLHYQYLAAEDGGLVRVAKSAGQHLEHLAEVLAGAAGADARTARFVESFVRPRGVSTPAATVFADDIEAMASIEPVRETLPAWGRLARLVLFPLAVFIKLQPATRRLEGTRRPLWTLPITWGVAAYVRLVRVKHAGAERGDSLGQQATRAGEVWRKRVRKTWRASAHAVSQLGEDSVRGSRRLWRRVENVGRALSDVPADTVKMFRRNSRSLMRPLRETTKHAKRTARTATAQVMKLARTSRYRMGMFLQKLRHS